VAPSHLEPWLPGLVHGADGVVLVVDLAADDVADEVAATLGLLDQARVTAASRSVPPGASPLAARLPVLVLLNKCDLDGDGTFAALAREVVPADLPVEVVSALRGDGLEVVRGTLFRALRRIRVRTKEPGHPPDPTRPFVLPEGSTVERLAEQVHLELAAHLRFARLWGPGARFDGQQVDRHHVLGDGDVVELHG
jgi:50S ribosomal subunit-associated GTPase HflX